MMVKAFGEVMMRLEVPKHLKLEQAQTLHVSYTGTGVNVLSALSRYGHQTSLITRLPLNSLGDAAISSIRSLGISVQDISRGGEYIGKYFLERGYSVRPTKVTYSNRQESSFCTSSLTDYDLEKSLKNTNLIHFCGITLAMSEHIRNTALQVAEMAKTLGITVVFDCNYRPKLWKYQTDQARQFYEAMLALTDICFMSEKDAIFLLKMETEKQVQHDKIKDLIPQVAEKYHIQTIAGTIRDNKSDQEVLQGFLYHLSSFTFSREYMYKILDRIGAGDGFASGIIHGMMYSFSVEDTIEFATASGVLAHTTYGDTPVCSLEEIWRLVRNEESAAIER